MLTAKDIFYQQSYEIDQQKYYRKRFYEELIQDDLASYDNNQYDVYDLQELFELDQAIDLD
jgi:hypothetical protein